MNIRSIAKKISENECNSKMMRAIASNVYASGIRYTRKTVNSGKQISGLNIDIDDVNQYYKMIKNAQPGIDY